MSILNPNNRIDIQLQDKTLWYTQVRFFNNNNIVIVYDNLEPKYLLYSL